MYFSYNFFCSLFKALKAQGTLVFSGAIFLFFMAQSALAGQPAWQVSADFVRASNEKNTVTGIGNVRLWQESNSIAAHEVTFNQVTYDAELTGDVEVFFQNVRLRADKANLNLNTQTGVLENGEIFVATMNLYLKGRRIEKLSEKRYYFYDAVVTTCDDESGPWAFAVKEGEVTLDGYAVLWHSRFQVQSVPILYLPVVALPAKGDRQSGLLPPQFGNSSTFGFLYEQPFYWAINDEMDMTFYERWFSKRGFLQGLEFRHTEDRRSKGLWKLDLMYDTDNAPTEADEDSQFRGDGLTRENNFRYWLRGKYDSYIVDPAVKMKLDVDFVSDQNYLREIDLDRLDIEKNNDEFIEHFGRGLENNTELLRESTFLVHRSYDSFGLAARAVWTDNLSYKNDNLPTSKNPTLQRLPELFAYAFKQKLLNTPLEWEARASTGYFWREYGVSGTRLSFEPTLSLPLSFSGVSVIPAVGFTATQYFAKDGEDTFKDLSPNSLRFVPQAQVTAFTEFFKVFTFDTEKELTLHKSFAGQSRWTKIKHSVQPRIGYYYQAEKDQDENPFFDDFDRLDQRNELIYSLTNILDRRRDVVRAVGGNSSQARLQPDYREFVRFYLAQSYDFDEAERRDMRHKYERRPFSDIEADLEIYPEKWLKFKTNLFYSPYLNKTTSWEQKVTIHSQEFFELGVSYNLRTALDEYKRTQDELEQLKTTLLLNINDSWEVDLLYRTDLEKEEELEKAVGITYLSQCWQATLGYSKTESDKRFFWRVKLSGMNF